MPGTVPFPDATSGSEMLTQGQETGCPLPAPSRIPIASEGSLKITRELPVRFLKFTSCDLFIFFFLIIIIQLTFTQVRLGATVREDPPSRALSSGQLHSGREGGQ